MASASINKRHAAQVRGSHPSKTAKGGAPSPVRVNLPTLAAKNAARMEHPRGEGRAAPGRFGPWGGRYVPETLMAALDELEREYERAKKDPRFKARLSELLKTFAGRPTPLFYARRLSQKLGGAKIYLKREDLLHTGAHKINNCIGQALLVERMGKNRVVAETGAGQHGVATATVCALFGFECVVYMGTEDMRRQELNVFRMRLLGAEVRGVDAGSRTLNDAINEAMRDWVTNVRTTHYLLGSVLGAHPYPTMVRDFHKVIGREARAQIMKAEGKLPTAIIACVGGGSNSIGIFYEFIKDKKVQLIGVEAGGRGRRLGDHPVHGVVRVRPLVARRRADQFRDLRVRDAGAALRFGDLDQLATLGHVLDGVGHGARVGQHEGADPMAVPTPEGERDVAAHRQSDDHRALDLQRIEHACDVVGVTIHRIRWGRGGLAQPAAVDRNAPAFADEGADLRLPHRAIERKRV